MRLEFLSLFICGIRSLVLLVVLSCQAWADEPGSRSTLAGELRTIGSYPIARNGHRITSAGHGRHFLHGAHPYWKRTFGDPKDNAFLKERRHAPLSQADRVGLLTREPWIWLPERRGWKRLGDLPECRGDPFLQAVTPTPDGGVLLTGGLCDEPKMANDPTGNPAYVRTSRLNGRSMTWEPSPELLNGRIYHTTSNLSDGSVIVVGGQSDPGVSAELFPVLSSVEWLRNKKFEEAAELHQARAGHTATVMVDDAILVTGGFDIKGLALASVERWDRATKQWQSLPSLKQARYGHRAILLVDGRLLVTGGFNAAGEPLASAELLDPSTGKWIAAAPVPIPVGFHESARLANGDVLLAPMISRMDYLPQPMAYLWRSETNTWELAATILADNSHYLGFVPAINLQADGKARIFGAAFIWSWTAVSATDKNRPRAWQGVPALARLDDHSAIVVPLSFHAGKWQRHAYRWDASTGVWQAAGNLHQTSLGHAQAIRLGSGRVLHLTKDGKNGLYCEISAADLGNHAWESCGQLASEGPSTSPFELGQLPDGRAMVISSPREAFIFDESRRQWQAATLVWSASESSSEWIFGTPVKLTVPFAQLIEAKESDSAKLDVSAQAGRFWSQTRGTAMLWNTTKAYWDYIFVNHQNIGRKPTHLPDGCAISMSPPSIFDPKTGTPRMLDISIPELDTRDNQTVVLGDGIVVAVSAPVGGVEAGWFVGKASCAGLVNTEGIKEVMPPEYAVDSPPSPVAQPPMHDKPSWRMRISDQIAAIPNLSWLALGVFLMLGLVRLWIKRRKADVEVSSGRWLDRPVSAKWRYLLRIVVWLGALVILVPLIVHYFSFRNAIEKISCVGKASACLDLDSGLIKGVSSLGNGRAGTHSGPHIPCRFVGQWSSIRDKQVRRITLTDDGTYQMAPLVQGGDLEVEYRGHWMVQSGNFVWRDNKGVAEMDINLIESESDGVFVLIEANGSRTKFERIEARPSSRCLAVQPQ
jgi:hypothetical protein